MQNPINQFLLSDLQKGERAYLTDIQITKNELSRCTSLGLTPGVEVTMIQNFGRGPLILKVRGTQIALGRGQARMFLVERFQA
jgi:ferrous iron transport protein A